MENINNLYFVDDILLLKYNHLRYVTLLFSDFSCFSVNHRVKPLKRYMPSSEAKNLYELYISGGDNTKVAKSFLKGLYDSEGSCIPKGWK